MGTTCPGSLGPSKSCPTCKFLTSNPPTAQILLSAMFLSLALSLQSSHALVSAGPSIPLLALLHTQPHPSPSVPSLFSPSVLGNLSVCDRFESSQAPCSAATPFGTTRRILPGTERSRSTSAHEQQLQAQCVNKLCLMQLGNHGEPSATRTREGPGARVGTGRYIHCDLHVGALRSFAPGRLQQPAKQHGVFWHMEVEELGVPVPAVEGQLLCTLREVLGDIEGAWKGESTAIAGGLLGPDCTAAPTAHKSSVADGEEPVVSLISHPSPMRHVVICVVPPAKTTHTPATKPSLGAREHYEMP